MSSIWSPSTMNYYYSHIICHGGGIPSVGPHHKANCAWFSIVITESKIVSHLSWLSRLHLSFFQMNKLSILSPLSSSQHYCHNHLITESKANPKVPLNIFTPNKKLVQTGFPSFLFTASRPRLIVKFIYACLMANWKPNLQNYGKFYASWHKHLKEMPPHCRQFVVEAINNATGRQVITAPTLTHTIRRAFDALRSAVTFINRHPLYWL